MDVVCCFKIFRFYVLKFTFLSCAHLFSLLPCCIAQSQFFAFLFFVWLFESLVTLIAVVGGARHSPLARVQFTVAAWRVRFFGALLTLVVVVGGARVSPSLVGVWSSSWCSLTPRCVIVFIVTLYVFAC